MDQPARPWVVWPLCLSSLLLGLLFLGTLVLSMVAVFSPEAVIAVTDWPGGGGLLHLAAGVPRWLQILMIAWMLTAAAMGLRQQPLGSAALGMGLVWDVGSVVVALLAALTTLEDLALISKLVTAPVLVALVLLALIRGAMTVVALRHPFYRVQQAT